MALEDFPPEMHEPMRVAAKAGFKPEPAELAQKREQICAQLEKEAKAASSPSVQQVLSRLQQVLVTLGAKNVYAETPFKLFSEALNKYREDASAPKPLPSIVDECVAFCQEYLKVTGYPETPAQTTPEKSAPAAAPTAKQPTHVTKDGFDSGSKSKAAGPKLSEEQFSPTGTTNQPTESNAETVKQLIHIIKG
jgi:hypothetical protein